MACSSVMRSWQIRLFSSHIHLRHNLEGKKGLQQCYEELSSHIHLRHNLEGKNGLQQCYEELANQAILFPFTLDPVQRARKACASFYSIQAVKILPFFRCSGRRTSQERNLHNELVIEMSALSPNYRVLQQSQKRHHQTTISRLRSAMWVSLQSYLPN